MIVGYYKYIANTASIWGSLHRLIMSNSLQTVLVTFTLFSSLFHLFRPLPNMSKVFVMPAWTTAVRVRSTLYWRRLNAYCMPVARLVLCPRVTIVLAEQQGENTCTRCHSLAQPLHPRLRDWTPALSLSCSPCHCYSLPRGPARGAGHYKRRDVARVRPPSTRNPEEVSVGALPSFRRFSHRYQNPVRSSSVNQDPAVGSSDCNRRSGSLGGLPHGPGDEPPRAFVVATARDMQCESSNPINCLLYCKIIWSMYRDWPVDSRVL